MISSPKWMIYLPFELPVLSNFFPSWRVLFQRDLLQYINLDEEISEKVTMTVPLTYTEENNKHNYYGKCNNNFKMKYTSWLSNVFLPWYLNTTQSQTSY